MAVSIQDVADRASVSRGTVSHVLNNRVGARISSGTQERVRRAAEELGYRPNYYARSLSQQKTNVIGLLISGLKNPFFVDILEAAEMMTRQAGLQPLFDSAPSSNSGTFETHGKLHEWPVDGALIWAFAYQNISMFLRTQARELPVVYLGYARNDEADFVAFDLAGGAQQMMAYLMQKAKGSVGFIAPYLNELLFQSTDERYLAYRGACEIAGVPMRCFPIDRSEEPRRAGMDIGLAIAALPDGKRPRALFCLNDVLAVSVYHGLRRGGLRIPDDIMLAGFDGIEEGQYLDVPLTTMLTSPQELIENAFPILLGRLRDELAPAPQQIIIPGRLLAGGTA